ncbi:helix-turn-helix domain-containing protein [Lucifera butyrica]
MIFAERLKELRNKHKISQTVLAELLKVSQRQISY